MDVSIGILVPLTIALTVLHVQMSFPNLREVLQGLVAKHEKDTLKELRIEEEMWQLRIRIYQVGSKFLMHLAFIALLMCIRDALVMPHFALFARVVFVFSTYLQHSMVGTGMIELTPNRMRVLCWFLHILLPLFMVANTNLQGNDFAYMQGFQVAVRYSIIFFTVQKEVSLPFQFVFTAVDLWTFRLSDGSTSLGPFLFSQAFVLGMGVAISYCLDLWARSRIEAVFDTADAESLLSSFRRMLRGVCDGEVLLDDKLRIRSESDCVKHLVFTTVSLLGRNFTSLLVEDEQQAFLDFIDSSTQQAAAEEQSESIRKAPQCLRVSFRGSSGMRVGVDIYHVPVAGFFGISEPHHLMAFKEDVEVQCLPDAQEDAVPSTLLSRDGNDHNRVQPVCSVSSRSSVSKQPLDLEEMTLLVDVSTDLQDVMEAHMRFQRHGEEPDEILALQSGMPSIRKFVKPTDWEKMRSRMAEYAEEAMQKPGISPKAVKRLSLRLLDRPSKFVNVKETVIKAYSGRTGEAPKVWLHMKGFKPEGRSRMHLDGIQEAQVKRRRDRQEPGE